MRVMIVDDNSSFREKIRLMLISHEAGALQFYEYKDGSGAVENYSKIEPDLILMDIQMDRMDGFVASKLIKDINRDAKIIMLTQYDDDAYRDYASEIGVDAYVIKDQLMDIIQIINNIRI